MYTDKKLCAIVFLLGLTVLLFAPLQNVEAQSSYWHFWIRDENDNTALMETTVTITMIRTGIDSQSFNITGYYMLTISSTYLANPPDYFIIDFTNYYGYNVTREYHLTPEEQVPDTTFEFYYCKAGVTATAISVFNYRTIEALTEQGCYITATTDIGRIVEKRVFDANGFVALNLQANKNYNILITSISTGAHYDFGYINTAISTITLNVPPMVFPDSIVNLYSYSYAWATRNFTTSTIVISYEDTTNQTTSLEIIISDPTNSTVYFDQTFTTGTNLLSYIWSYGVNATSYNVWVVVTSSTAGTYYFKQYLQGEYTKASDPFDFGFLGSISGLNTAMFIPALLIIFAAGCFSQLTAEVAAFLTSITAIILVLMGWISISNSMLIVALSLSVLASVVGARRRFG